MKDTLEIPTEALVEHVINEVMLNRDIEWNVDKEEVDVRLPQDLFKTVTDVEIVGDGGGYMVLVFGTVEGREPVRRIRATWDNPPEVITAEYLVWWTAGLSLGNRDRDPEAWLIFERA